MKQMQNGQSLRTETLRATYRPSRIHVLFVGESAPINETFFYRGNSNLYRAMQKAFGAGPRFLDEFKASGFYLDDLVLEPVNHKTNTERRMLHKSNEGSLALRIGQASPRLVVSVMKGIAPSVETALRTSGHKAPHRSVSFPANGRQGDFAREMAALMPELRSHSAR